MLSKPTWILVAVMALLTGGAMWAGRTGLGAPTATKHTVNIREGSVRSGSRPRSRGWFFGGSSRGRSFRGGGFSGGK